MNTFAPARLTQTRANEITILCFFASDHALAIAAKGVEILATTDAAHPYIGTLLHLSDDAGWGDDSTQRSLYFLHAGKRVGVRVDGPVTMGHLERGQIRKTPPFLPLVRRELILGFAHVGDRLTTLLDIPGLIGLTIGHAH